MNLRSRRLVEGAISGQHRSPFHGFNIEFAEYRDYNPGDDLRRLDWRVYARTDRHYIKQYEEESNVRVTFRRRCERIDELSRLGAVLSKFDYAATLVVSLAMLLTRQQDPVGLVLFDEKANTILPPSATQSQILVMSSLLEKCQPARKTELGGLLLSLADQFRRRNLVVIVSDLFTDLDKLYDALNRLRFSGHEVLVMQVLDRDELELPVRGTDGLPRHRGRGRAVRRALGVSPVVPERDERVSRECPQGLRRPRLRSREVLDRRVARCLAQLFLAFPRGNRPGHPPGYAFSMMTFLSPLLIWGALLGAIPLIIHLLNRRRFRRVEWAPMHYLKLTIQRNRKRIQLEQLLLLLLRIALPVLLFFFLARPIINPDGARAMAGHRRPLQPGRLDRRFGEHGLHGRRGVGLSAGAAVGGRAPGCDPPARPLHGGDNLVAPGSGDPRRRGLAPRRDRGRRRVRAAHRHARRVAGRARGRRRSLEVVHLSHEAAHRSSPTCARAGGMPAPRRSAAAGASRSVRVRIVDVGSDEVANVSLQALVADRPHDPGRCALGLGGGDPQRLAAHAHQQQGHPARRRQADRGGAAGDRASSDGARCRSSVPFPGSGPHELSLQAPGRRAAGRQHALGRRAGQGFALDSPGGWRAVIGAVWLRGRLSRRARCRSASARPRPGASRSSRIKISCRSASTPPTCSSWPTSPPRRSSRRERLGRLVKAGMGLLIFTGGKLDVGLYNDLFYRAERPGLAVPLEEPGRREHSRAVCRAAASVAAREAPGAQALGTRARVGPPDHDGRREGRSSDQVRVLARWNNPARSPAVAERVLGEGRVLLWTTTADRAGNDWPIEPSFVLAVREAVRGSARPTRFDNTVTGRRADEARRLLEPAGLQCPLDSSRRRRAAGRCAVVPLGEEPGDRGPAVEINVPDTRQPGSYRLAWDEGSLGTQQDLYAANPDPRESALERIAAAELKSMLEPLEIEIAVAARGWLRTLRRDRPRDLARPGGRAARSVDCRVDIRNLGRPLTLTPSRSNRRP